MKASVIIQELQSLIDKHGDREVEVNGKWNSDIVITPYSFFEIDSIDLFPDSNNLQLFVKNG